MSWLHLYGTLVDLLLAMDPFKLRCYNYAEMSVLQPSYNVRNRYLKTVRFKTE